MVKLNKLKQLNNIASPCMRLCDRDSNDICFGCRRTSGQFS
ncbi:MAG: DUF1289 domain-containing protein [Bacteroidetes bacterium]|nr:DUF1289 domain-containing protein [Bacteroidota bacterium]